MQRQIPPEGDEGEYPDRNGDAEQLPAPPPAVTGVETGNRRAVVNHQRQATPDGHPAEGDNKRRQAQARDAQTMQEANCRAHRQTNPQPNQPAHATPGVRVDGGEVVALDHVRRGHGAHRQNGADGKVDPGGQDDESHPHGHDPVDGDFG